MLESSPTQAARVVLTRRIFPALCDALRASYDLVDNQQDAVLTAAELTQRVAGADGLLCTPGERVDDALLARSPRLRVVSNIAVGFNNIDLAACTRHGVAATNTPDVLTEATADHAWALLLAAARRVVESDRWTRAGRWRRWDFDAFLGADLHGSTLGVLGMGRIGRAIARRAAGFSMRVVYHSRRRLAAEHEAGAQWLPLDQMLRSVDHLMIVVPYSESTRHLIGAAELASMKPGSVLVNIARGGVVDDAALVAALQSGRPGAAGLDVFENEPALHPGLLPLENLVITPHIGSATRSSREGMAQLAIGNLAQVLAGERPAALLNPEVWEVRRGG